MNEEGNVSVKLKTKEVSLLRKTMKKFTSALKDFSETKGLGNIKDMAKALWDFFQAIWKGIGKVIFDAFAASLSWWQWIEVAVVALGTLLVWLASDGLAALGELILLINNAVLTFDAWYTALSIGSPEDFIQALINNGGSLSDQIIINQLYNPSVIDYGEYVFVFVNSQALVESVNASSGNQVSTRDKSAYLPGVEFSYAQRDSLYAVLEQRAALDSYTTKEQIEANMTTDSLPAYWHNFKVIPGTETNASSPCAVLFNNQIYVFFRQIDGDTHIKYCILTNPSDPENPNWAGPYSMPESVNTSTSPAAAVLDNKLYVFYQGSGEGDIWHDVFDGSNWEGIAKVPGAATSTTPAVKNISGNLFLTYKSSTDTRVWLSFFADGRWTEDPIEFTYYVNTKTTPQLVVSNGSEVDLYYVGLGDSPEVFTHEFPDVGELNKLDLTSVFDLDKDIIANQDYNTGFGVNSGSPDFIEDLANNLMFYTNGPGSLEFSLAPKANR